MRASLVRVKVVLDFVRRIGREVVMMITTSLLPGTFLESLMVISRFVVILQTEGVRGLEVVQTQPVSTPQEFEHPSPSSLFPSSQGAK